MGLEAFLIFLSTTVVVILSPGASAVLVATQGARNGYTATVFSVFGIMLATAVYFILSATGLAALILASHLSFQIVKWLGVAYLFYLGIIAISAKSGGLTVQVGKVQKSKAVLFAQGFMVEFANPKALLYFAAILPQFLDTTKPIAPQMLVMGATGIALQFAIYSVYAKLGNRLATSGVRPMTVNWLNRTAGVALIIAGLKMASIDQEG